MFPPGVGLGGVPGIGGVAGGGGQPPVDKQDIQKVRSTIKWNIVSYFRTVKKSNRKVQQSTYAWNASHWLQAYRSGHQMAIESLGFLIRAAFLSILHTLGLTKTQLALWVALWHKELRIASYSCVEYNNSGKHFEDLTIQYLNRCVWTTEWRVKHLGCMMQWRLFHKNTMRF